jgi:microcompartment protein CcmK/EutM
VLKLSDGSYVVHLIATSGPDHVFGSDVGPPTPPVLRAYTNRMRRGAARTNVLFRAVVTGSSRQVVARLAEHGDMSFPRLRAFAPVFAVFLLLAFGAGSVHAAAPSIAPAKEGKASKRKGGKVRDAWPKGSGGKPHTALERWLARQVGPRRPRACAVRKRGCRNERSFARSAEVRTAAATTIPASSATDPLALVRSYDIPAGDPSYDRLLNWSWTYDSAVTAAAFAAAGYPTQAERLLDQLKALQHTDGSIESAFNVYTGESSGQLRSGTVAWTGLAAATYKGARGDSRYDEVATDAATWLLAQRDLRAGSPTYGLVRGGPDVTWYSTQHNLVTYLLLTRLAEASTWSKAKTYRDAANGIADGIDRQLLVQAGSSAYFRQGYGDDSRPLDTQTIGALYLVSRGQFLTAVRVRSYIESSFAVTGRSITKSSVAGVFNQTFAAAGPFSGYRPYADATGPDVLWAEGTAQVRLLRASLFDSVNALDSTIRAWDDVAGSAGPLQSDRTVTNHPLNEYHVWPAAAAGAWRILSGAPSDFFVVSR